MKTAKKRAKLLRKTKEELTVGKQLLAEKKSRAKKAKGKLARKNAKRAAKLIELTVVSIADHRHLLLEEEKAESDKENS
jgi:hypothetical protein